MRDHQHTDTTQEPNRPANRGATREAGAPSRRKADPPLLIGGLQQTQSAILSPQGVSVDWISATLPPATSEIMMHHTTPHEAGSPTTGFRSSEQRQCLGGFCWRKWDPHTSSKAYGTDYESWEFSGPTARDPAERLRGHPCRLSRVDVAFDFQTPPRVYPRHVEYLIRHHVRARGLSIGYRGESLTRTVYVGSPKSDRFIRIYRRDLKHPELPFPILRVELVLTKRLARAWWSEREASHTTGYPTAAAHVHDLTGYAPQVDLDDLPPTIMADDESTAAQMLFQFVHQNAVMLRACDAAGIDLGRLAVAKFENPSRFHTTRIAQKLDKLSQVPAERLESLVIEQLNRGNA